MQRKDHALFEPISCFMLYYHLQQILARYVGGACVGGGGKWTKAQKVKTFKCSVKTVPY